MDKYTLTDLINAMSGNGSWRDCTDYKFNEDRTILTITAQGYGDSIDYKNDAYSDGWEEDSMVYQDFYPLWDDETTEDLDDGVTHMRSHSYKSVIIDFTLTLPPNRKRGDTYTVAELREMISEVDYVYENPGCGFNYYNVDDDEEE